MPISIPTYIITERILSELDVHCDLSTGDPLRTHIAVMGTAISTSLPTVERAAVVSRLPLPRSGRPSCRMVGSRDRATFCDPPGYRQPRLAPHAIVVVRAEFRSLSKCLHCLSQNQADGPAAAAPRGKRQWLTDLAGPWEVAFDPAWGGPENLFDKLTTGHSGPRKASVTTPARPSISNGLICPRKCGSMQRTIAVYPWAPFTTWLP